MEAAVKGRAEEFKNIAGEQFDLCVIGGGATGSGCALDAQLRGIRTVLLEAGDFVAGYAGCGLRHRASENRWAGSFSRQDWLATHHLFQRPENPMDSRTRKRRP